MDIDFRKVDECKLLIKPFPHLVVDSFLSKSLLEEISDNWPSDKLHNDLRGNHLFLFSSELNKSQVVDKDFWTIFIKNTIHKISLKLAKKFLPFFSFKLGEGVLEFGTGYAQQNIDEIGQQDFAPHTHFDHDPLWVLTFLIYISDENNNSPGTSLYQLGADEKAAVRNFMKWNEIWNVPDDDRPYSQKIRMINDLNLEHTKTVSFQPNRLFAFLDGPFSFHGVHYQPSNRPINRRSLRFAVGVRRSEILTHYGIKPEDWPKLFTDRHPVRLEKILRAEYNALMLSPLKRLSLSMFRPKHIELSQYPLF